MAVQRQALKSNPQDLVGDFGLLEGPYLHSRFSLVPKKLTSTVRRPLRKTYRTQKSFSNLGSETLETIAMALVQI